MLTAFWHSPDILYEEGGEKKSSITRQISNKSMNEDDEEQPGLNSEAWQISPLFLPFCGPQQRDPVHTGYRRPLANYGEIGLVNTSASLQGV